MVRGITAVQGVAELRKTLRQLLAMEAVGKVAPVAIDPIRE